MALVDLGVAEPSDLAEIEDEDLVEAGAHRGLLKLHVKYLFHHFVNDEIGG